MEDLRKYGKLNIYCDNLENNPQCPHGPALLFERVTCSGKVQKFYACSAYRSKKICSFFIPYGNVKSVKKSLGILEKKHTRVQKYQQNKELNRLNNIRRVSPEERGFCHTCDCLIYLNEYGLHKAHTITKPLSDFFINHPSQLLHLKTVSKGESQFIFSKNSVDVIINALKNLNISKAICLGTPSIHERLQEHSVNIKSLFLDLDDRYKQFYKEEDFCHFNMMNFYFFDNLKSYNIVYEFLRDSDVALIMDPPFSARAEPLSYTLARFNLIFQECKNSKNLPVVWIFPYFKEDEVVGSYPDMVMLDYDVRYVNHKLFKESRDIKTSVVRIFTNLDPSKFTFPVEEGYHFCSSCTRWVSKFNIHCIKCGICPSKNGQPYKHCDKCSRCVKNYWQHCEKCERCALEKHPCDKFQICGGSQEKQMKQVKRKRVETEKTIQNTSLRNKVKTRNISKKRKKKYK